jgi:hypothetical protein
LLLIAGVLATPALAGPKWEIGEDSWMTLAFLGQVHYAHTDDAAQEDDFFLRRGRFILAGQIMDGVKFFVETDNDNAGKAGTDVSTDIQDAFMDVRLGNSDHWVEAGLILLPFSFESKSSAAKLLGHDYNSEAVKLTNSFVWRDYGVELHGHFGKQLAYRVGVFDGYDAKGSSKNPDAGLRYTGHVAFNLVGEVETGWFLTQSRFKGTYLSLGAGADHQSDATLTSGSKEIDSTAWVVDFQSGVQVNDGTHLTVNGAWYDWDNAGFEGNTAFVEAGLLLSKIMPTAKYSLVEPDDGDSTTDYTVGVHYFMKGHNARLGLEYRFGDSPDLALLGLQFLL